MSDDNTQTCPDCGGELHHETHKKKVSPTSDMSEGQFALASAGHMHRTMHTYSCEDCPHYHTEIGGLS